MPASNTEPPKRRPSWVMASQEVSRRQTQSGATTSPNSPNPGHMTSRKTRQTQGEGAAAVAAARPPSQARRSAPRRDAGPACRDACGAPRLSGRWCGCRPVRAASPLLARALTRHAESRAEQSQRGREEERLEIPPIHPSRGKNPPFPSPVSPASLASNHRITPILSLSHDLFYFRFPAPHRRRPVHPRITSISQQIPRTRNYSLFYSFSHALSRATPPARRRSTPGTPLRQLHALSLRPDRLN